MEGGDFRHIFEQDDSWALGSHPWNSFGLFGILLASSQNFKMAAEVLHVLICKCSMQEEMEGVLISCRVFFLLWRKIFCKTSTSNFYL